MKSKLEPGMILKFRNKEYGIFLKFNSVQCVLNLNGGGVISDLTQHSETLKSAYTPCFDVVEVYEFNIGLLAKPEASIPLCGKLLWKENDVVELTLSDIARKFNIDVDKIRIKE